MPKVLPPPSNFIATVWTEPFSSVSDLYIPMTCTYGFSHFIQIKTGATEMEIHFVSTWIMFPSLLPQFGSALSLLKKYFVRIMNVQVVSVWWWVIKSEQRCSAAFCRPVKFFHTDWIIISLWFLSYTQRHCHVRIEKAPVQIVSIKLDSLEYHYMLKH